jgi:hypothetical protein
MEFYLDFEINRYIASSYSFFIPDNLNLTSWSISKGIALRTGKMQLRSMKPFNFKVKRQIKSHLEFPAKKLVDALLMDVQSYMGETPQSDDIALAVLTQESDT